MTDARRLPPQKGSALLAVLWLIAALSAIAFSVATTVRGEVERSSTAADGARAYFLARGAFERALMWIQWGDIRNPDGSPRYWAPGVTRLHFEFPGGAAEVELIPESAKLNVNLIPPLELFRLIVFAGVPEDAARVLTAAIVDWRAPVPQGLSEFDQFYMSLTPSFRSRHASLEEIEDLLLVRGMTPELFHGTWQRNEEGRLIALAGLKDCLSVYSQSQSVDINTAQIPTLAAVGVPPDAIQAILQIRRAMPFRTMQQVMAFASPMGQAGARLTLGQGTITTIRATARVRLPNGQLSDLRRTVAGLVKFAPVTKDAPYHILRWYDQGGLGVEDMQ